MILKKWLENAKKDKDEYIYKNNLEIYELISDDHIYYNEVID